MVVGLLTGIVHDRKLMREAQVNVAIRWFVAYGLHEQLPHHSSLTDAYSPALGRRAVPQDLQPHGRGLPEGRDRRSGGGPHIDASLSRANVSWDSLTEQHVLNILSESQSEDESEVERTGRQSGKYNKVRTTDPDAMMATNARNKRLEPS